MHPPRFRVIISPMEADKLRRWAEWAGSRGRRAAFLRALRILNDRMSHEPNDAWSEQFADLPGLQLQLRFGAEDMLAVSFGVHAGDAIVFVRQFHWLGAKSEPRPPLA